MQTFPVHHGPQKGHSSVAQFVFPRAEPAGLSVWLLSPTRDAIICTRTRSAMTQAADPHQLRRDQWIARVAALADQIKGWCQSLGWPVEEDRKTIEEEM